ncbi:FtsP/CotA-like multicopper oxidase with cupredoxin domain [Kitasatospora sp. MAP12-15]|uniref:multicopper oxidase domain-containing protein n=1 Tax=unclassified Kitasatospora TaxID=2633591 RepID=UPI002474581D|nr:multicopper oxidase domain-containing protein [Kitasatospora sp. MAP12-44]MDH6109829.1 FtsP/CotA-like multicopper oxidase with cupredoxin domain [Kitasatospora sp. MAP12-44]
MPTEPTEPTAVTDTRRGAMRTLLAGSAIAALAGSAALGASAVAQADPPTGAAAPDPFAADALPSGGRVREYWVQAESFEHNAVPNGYDGMMGTRYTAEQTTFWAIGFRAYTPNFGAPLPADTSPTGIGTNSGIPGPVLRAHVGDTLIVHFRNNDAHYQWPHSMHPHGVRYDGNNDGGWLADDPAHAGTAIPYGGTYTYTWTALPSSVGTWPYHDHSIPQTCPAPASTTAAAAPHAGMAMGAGGGVMEIGAELGLFGIIAVTDAHTPPVDREFILFFHDAYAADVPALAQDTDMFNGGAFLDNTPTFTARNGERIRWRIAALGKEFHVFHLHGHRWLRGDRFVDSEILGPSTTLTVEYTENNPGDWIYHCHVTDHMMGGMVGRYQVSGS